MTKEDFVKLQIGALRQRYRMAEHLQEKHKDKFPVVVDAAYTEERLCEAELQYWKEQL